jgi:predicted MPP superfamily phosphohydrolase
MLGMNRLDLVMEKLPEKGPAILLAHEPDFADISSSTGRFSLQISGHSMVDSSSSQFGNLHQGSSFL